jgi:pyridoxine 4-dehydrogenase
MCKGTIPIPGAKSVKQMEDNLGSMGWKLNDSEVIELDQVANQLDKKMVQNIFQTT